MNLSKHTKCCKKLGGQHGQAFEVENILGLKTSQKDTKGFFIEAGAVDGEYLSNTLFFEMKYRQVKLLVLDFTTRWCLVKSQLILCFSDSSG